MFAAVLIIAFFGSLQLADLLNPGRTIFNVVDYGAKGDEAADDTAAIQAAIEAAEVSTASSRVIYLPSGHYKITHTLTLTRQSHITFMGGGASSAVLKWYGAQSGTMLALRGLQDSRITGFMMQGDGTTTAIRYDGLADMASKNNVFDELTTYIQKFGMRIGADHFQTSDSLFRRSLFLNSTYEGTSIEDVQSTHLSFEDVIWTGGKKGITAAAGHFNLYGCGIGSTTDVDIEVAPSPIETIISHTWTEQGPEFLRVNDGQPTTVTVIEGSINTLDPGKKMMEFLSPGTLTIVGGIYRTLKILPGQIEIGNHPDQRTRINIIGTTFDGNPFSESPLLARGMATVHLTGIQLDNPYSLHDPAQTDSLMSIGTQRKPLIATAPLNWAGAAWLKIPSGTVLDAGDNIFMGSSLNADGATAVHVDILLPTDEPAPLSVSADDSGSHRYTLHVRTQSGTTLAHDLIFHVVFDVALLPKITDPAPPLDDTPIYTPVVETGSGHFFNVKDFGAIGDGNTDDTDAIQTAVDAAEKDYAYWLAGSKGTVYLPAGTYKITKSITVGPEGGQNFIGEDMDRTKLVWAGAQSGAMLNIFGVANAHIGKFTLIGDGQTTIGLAYDGVTNWNGRGSNADFNMFDHIAVTDQHICMNISKQMFQTDISMYQYMQFKRCAYGVLIYDANAVMHNFYHSLWEDTGIGIAPGPGTGGSYSIIDSTFRRSTVADFMLYPSGRPALFLRVHSEGSRTFLGSGGNGASSSQSTYIDCTVDSLTDPLPALMSFNVTGGATIVGGVFHSGQAQAGQMLHASPWNRSNLTIIGAQFDGNPILDSIDPSAWSISTVLRQTNFGSQLMDDRYSLGSQSAPLPLSTNLQFVAGAWLRIASGTLLHAGQNSFHGTSKNMAGRTAIVIGQINAVGSAIGATLSAKDDGDNAYHIVITVAQDVTLADDLVFHASFNPESAESVPLQPIVPHVDDLQPTSATINWTTPVPTDWQIHFSSMPGFGTLNWAYLEWIGNAWDEPLIASHTQTLTNLSPGTLYHFYVRSQDATGLVSVSRDYTFVTPGTRQPAIRNNVTISNVTVSDQTDTSAVIRWVTDTATGSLIEYGPGILYESMTDIDKTPLTDHQVTLRHLLPGTLYHFRVRTDHKDVSDDTTFMTSYPPVDQVCSHSFTTSHLFGQKGSVLVYMIPALIDCAHLEPNSIYIVQTADIPRRPFSASVVRSADGLPATFSVYRYTSVDAHVERDHDHNSNFLSRFPGQFAASTAALADSTFTGFAAMHGFSWLPVDHSQQAVKLEAHSLYVIKTSSESGGMTIGIH